MPDNLRPVLGIETSCDETASAVLDADGRVLAEAVLSQEREHAQYGGVVPEIAARAHVALLPEQVRGVMARAGLGYGELGGVAASAGPGLIGGLIVGSQFAKGIAIAHRLPYVAVNHLEAHALTARLPGLVPGGVAFPYLLLLVSGGHCQCVAVHGVGHHVRLGSTLDDAAGEAFDKVAKLLGLGWPGGPALEKLAAGGDPARHAFPRPLLGRAGCDFSFSGLKTAVAHEVARHGGGALPLSVAADIAASFQRAVAEVLADRAGHAIAMMRARAPEAACWWSPAGLRPMASIRAALAQVAAATRIRVGGTAGTAVHRQCGDGGLGRHRAAATGPVRWSGFRATAALAAGRIGRLMRPGLLLLFVLLSACAAPPTPPDAHVPPFARVPYQAFSRDAVVAIALREWRLFGSPVDDNPPGTYRPATPQDKPERQQGYWQRIGEYWWLAMNAGSPEVRLDRQARRQRCRVSRQRGRHLRVVGCLRLLRHAHRRRRAAVPLFRQPLRLHQRRHGADRRGWLIAARRPESYAPQPGDLICLGRGDARDLRFDDLPAGHFPGHCDIVVDTGVPGQISVVGGNVDDAVTLKHVPTTPDGRLATPDGKVLDNRYPWMVVLQLLAGAPVA